MANGIGIISADIPYTDSSFLRIEINTRTEDRGPEEGLFTIKLYDDDWCMYNEEYTFFTRPEDPTRFYKRWQHVEGFPAKYFQCDMSYYDQLSIMGKVNDHIHILHGDIQNFDSVYYSSETGFIRMVSDSLVYSVLQNPHKK